MVEKKKSREQIEKERTEFLDLQKHKQDLQNDPTKKPAKKISGWGSKLTPVKKDRMGEKPTITRRKMGA